MGRIEYIKATESDAEIVCNIVRGTKAVIYPHYYTQASLEDFIVLRI